MLDLRYITEKTEDLKKVLELRGFKEIGIIDELKAIIQRKREFQKEADILREERNKTSKEVGRIKQSGGDITEISASVKLVGEKIKEIETKLEQEENALLNINLGLPNILDPKVPSGKSEHDNIVQYEVGKIPSFQFAPKTHFEIGEALHWINFEKGVKLSGARAYTYWKDGARLERALMNFMLDVHTKEHGYTEVWVPSMVNDESMMATGQYPKFKDEFYRIDKDELNLIPTAEVPLTNLYRDEIIPEDQLPISVTAHTSCFRREAGSYGKDTRGLVRVHQFQKVELVKFCKPEDSEEEHKKMLSHAENILKKLELPYRVIILCSGDISANSSITYDIEVWMPGLNRYMEISSVSNFRDFQARRGKIRYKSKDGKNQLVHTINGSGLALGRTYAAILENFQNEDRTVRIPEVLKSYF
ncbi:serine--tRNA ligase [Leptospira noguchii]|uniref:Serine--tRNA ligase n=1 Tax=Leptospira noguchii TaxID=28182 RepID=A0A9Q8VX65_9LEPT|nr:serine--tRNA ligase [Leptospira noguchii]TQE74198.1 serine--tRNA ligase [Leptospira noguchii]UOG34221.1 serine--tRNA ligase [Leptospira noguchii]UOG45086.1 serine--tRNA ligase [Leptospira noguchii]UOG52659.1 serine--tRNA ligase [Leptospira noguchii]UOG56645.1 serine--tRNA ligase [Leptospira noguchii]